MAPKVAPKRRSAWLANALQRAEARRSSSAAKPRPQKYLQGVDVVALRAHVAAAAVAEAVAAADAGPSTMHDLPQPPPSAGAPRKPPARGVATHRLAVAADSWTGASVSASGWKRCRGSDLYMWHRSVTRKSTSLRPSSCSQLLLTHCLRAQSQIFGNFLAQMARSHRMLPHWRLL